MSTIADLYARADWSSVHFPKNGHWWSDRASTEVPADGELTVWLVGDTEGPGSLPPQAVKLTGIPEMLRRVAQAITAHVEAAEANTRH